jgi:hypothetical protein
MRRRAGVKSNNKRIHFGLFMGVGMFLAAFLLFPRGYGSAVAGAEVPDKATVQECLLKALETAPGGDDS